MDWQTIQYSLLQVQHAISCIGILIIFSGVLFAFWRYMQYLFTAQLLSSNGRINEVRLDLGRVLILGLEFIVAADLIGSVTTPDYYGVGILAIIVLIRTLLSYSLTLEMNALSKN
jgi:uncharacterized membrane protein